MSSTTLRGLWAHATNSQKLLDTALNNKCINFIEADVIIGRLKGDTSQRSFPIMAHPPETSSDLSLSTFISTLNKAESASLKVVKLDIKMTTGLEDCLKVLAFEHEKKSFTFELWLNADILKGVESFCNNSGPTTNSIPVEPNLFLQLCQKYFATAVLSPGFTTFYNETQSINHSEIIPDDANKYNKDLMNSMVETLKSNHCLGKNIKINFPLRAIFAINSIEEIIYLLEETGSSSNTSTITIWGQEKLNQNQIEKLKCLIKKIGSHKIYLDVHEDLRNVILEDLSL